MNNLILNRDAKYRVSTAEMEGIYRNRYRIASARLTGWDYGSHGLYFITICTKDRVHYFGEIKNAETQDRASLSPTDIGKVAYDNWLQIPLFHPYVELDEFVVMPDHIHGILFINKPDKISWEATKFGAQSNNMASIVRGYKSSVKKYATLNNLYFFWQPRYYDRVIRSQEEYDKIKEYIYLNPDQWLMNKDNFENIFNL